MSNSYTIHGHAYAREFHYIGKDGHAEREEYTLPGGAALIAKLLGCETRLPENARREYFELDEFKHKDGGKYRALVRRLGIRQGTADFTIGGGGYTVVYDHGLSAVTLPENARNVMWATRRRLPGQTGGIDLLFIDGDVLRNGGAMISKAVSWERTVMNLLWQLRNNKNDNGLIGNLPNIPRIIVTFGQDGAVYIENTDGVTTSAWLYLLNGRCEGNLQKERVDSRGHLGDAFYIMAAAAAAQMPEILADIPARRKPDKKPAVELWRVLKKGAAFIGRGYETDARIVSCPYDFEIEYENGDDLREVKLLPGGNTPPPDTYLIADSTDEKKVLSDAVEYVRTGKGALTRLPMLKIGGLNSVDRWEIEAFHNIRNAMLAYADSRERQPLCIGVFGTPGSGKSFGVKQIAEHVLGGCCRAKTFNVSQFTGEDDLCAAFQQVRDIVLDGKMPLVFFDEFDSDRDGRAKGWLKNFLMLMQDGEFKDGAGTHPLGRCILVFAGGTAATFDECSEPGSTRDEIDAGKARKTPDFVSRVKASINIAGPNPRGRDDNNFILRRALLLRSFMERFGISYIDGNILKAMLLVPRYHHGARSMETIIKMSRITDGKWVPAGLPLGDQMKIHLNDRMFTDILLIKTIEQSPVGVMAREIHKLYRSHLEGDGHKLPNNVDWDDLPMHFKLDNLGQARDYDNKAARFGGVIGFIGDKDKEVIELNDEKIVEELAIAEHIRWMKAKEEDGWTPGLLRDDAKKIHDCMWAWNEFEEKYGRKKAELIKGKDLNAIREMSRVLKAADMCIYKK
ncbi:MAG: hypothetical protein FWF13_01080 [Acidobacteria bacterium]|nr:hypothetical protein [Acidobacteriota bacterium]